jgi:hypothetical protein
MKEVPHVIGVDLGKSVRQIHAVDRTGRVIARRRLRSEVLSFFTRCFPNDCRDGSLRVPLDAGTFLARAPTLWFILF